VTAPLVVMATTEYDLGGLLADRQREEEEQQRQEEEEQEQRVKLNLT